MSSCWWLKPNLETTGGDENLDDITPLEAHTRICLRLMQVMTLSQGMKLGEGWAVKVNGATQTRTVT
jgi:hypothetical protein